MALLLLRGFSTPSLLAQGEQRLPSYFNIRRDIPVQEAEKYQSELRAMVPGQLQALYQQEQADERMERRREADRLETEGFFNQAGAKADFAHWSKAAYWTLDEAIALSLGKAPEVVNWKQVQEYAGQSSFADQYSKRRDLTLRAVYRKQLDDRVSPGFFLAWAKRNDIDFPAELETQVVARGHQIADWKSLYDELSRQFNELKARHDADAAERDSLRLRVEELGQAAGQGQAKEKSLRTRERNTALKLIIGMAVGGYAYDPNPKKRSDTSSQIVSDLNLVGLSLDEDTVRKWLKEAAGLLPSDWDGQTAR